MLLHQWSISCPPKGVLDLYRRQFILPEHMSSPPVFSEVRVTLSLVLCVCFVNRCLYFFLWSLCCLYFFNLTIPITHLVSSNSSYQIFTDFYKSCIAESVVNLTSHWSIRCFLWCYFCHHRGVIAGVLTSSW